MRPKKILLVDDDSMGIELTLAAFESASLAGYVAVVNDGVAALDYLNRAGKFESRDGGDPIVVLLDLNMPRMDGHQVLERIRSSSRLRNIPVVVFSSSREESDKLQSYALGANAYVVKPMDFGQFEATVRQIGHFWAEVNVPPPQSAVGVCP